MIMMYDEGLIMRLDIMIMIMIKLMIMIMIMIELMIMILIMIKLMIMILIMLRTLLAAGAGGQFDELCCFDLSTCVKAVLVATRPTLAIVLIAVMIMIRKYKANNTKL